MAPDWRQDMAAFYYRLPLVVYNSIRAYGQRNMFESREHCSHEPPWTSVLIKNVDLATEFQSLFLALFFGPQKAALFSWSSIV